MKANKRSGKNYLIMGTADQGIDPSVLSLFAAIASHYEATPVHVGPLATDDEIKMYRRRLNILKTWENASKERTKKRKYHSDSKINDLSKKMEQVREEIRKAPRDQKEKYSKKLKGLKDKVNRITEDDKLHWREMSHTGEEIREELESLLAIQTGRVGDIQQAFETDVHFVCNDELMLPVDPYEDLGIPELLYHDQYWSLSEHLNVTAIPANGNKVAGAPITPRTFRMLKSFGSSHIVPHATPHIRPFRRSGLNQAYNYVTTGAMQVQDAPKRSRQAFKTSARASAILVTVDEKNGEFHYQRMLVKMHWGQTNHKMIPHVAHDGLVFDSSGAVEESATVDRLMFITDSHSPYQHRGVIAAWRFLAKIYQPETIVDGGDASDFSSVSRHTESLPGLRENLRIANDLNGLRSYLDSVGCPKTFPFIKKRVLIDSNHHEWVTQFVNRNPTLIGLLDWPSLAKVYFPDWDVFIRRPGEDRSFRFGDLIVRHGDNEGSITVASDIHGNYLAGHHHSAIEWVEAQFVGPSCSLGPGYLCNSVTSWQNQLTLVTRFRGKTCKHPRIILHDEDKKTSRFSYRGEIYEVNFHKG